MVVGQRPRVENDTDTIPGVLPLAILMRPVGAKQQGLSALYLGFQAPNALTHPSFSGWLFSFQLPQASIHRALQKIQVGDMLYSDKQGKE
ncbi:Uncharacterised protein [Candidatus Venteria ishoeyi]|uniref:Uncharacterized protein n=2 Tax=Candidatus Venteria ishoeyi TaxID=1899563 RepID=A0A1H6FA05_9GAMM|nr:Uncharacterised protein [Candidatus Venteria ishoeyi]